MRLKLMLGMTLMIALLPGCAGVLTGGADAPAPAPPQRVAYALTITFVDAPASMAVGTGVGGANGTAQEVGDAAFGLAAWGSKLPLIGWMFGARVAERASRNFAGKDGAGAPVTPAVFISAIQSGRVKSIAYTPIELKGP